jgi:hypothetical protein
MGFNPWQRQETFLFSTASITALEPTQSPIQRIPEDPSPEAKWLGHEADHSAPSSAKAKNSGAISPLSYMFSRHNAYLI